jgi:hypothetical protein
VIQKWRMKITALLSVLFAFLLGAAPALAQTNAHSSPEERQRFVTIVHNLERAPLDPVLRGDRSWAVQWLIDVPDVSVNVCLDPLRGVSDKHFAHAAEVVVQYSLAMAAFIIESPAAANDPDAQQLAGVEGALNAYRAMRTAQPDKKSPELEDLLGMQSRGELPDFVRKAYARCLAKS